MPDTVPPPLPIGRALKLCADLIQSATADLCTWELRQDVNWAAAGQAALSDIETVIHYLTQVRAEIVPPLLMDDARNRAKVADLPDLPRLPGQAGNSGPGW